MKINFEDVKIGDYVTVRMKVIKQDKKEDKTQSFKLQPISENFEAMWFYNDDIVTHEPRALAIGDIVRLKGETHKFKLIGIDEDAAWIKSIPTGTWMPSTMLSNLERAE